MNYSEETFGVPGSKHHTPAEMDEHAIINGVHGKKVFVVDSAGNQIDGATKNNQRPPATTSTIYNITMTTADTEYSQALPANTKAITIQCQADYAVRFAFETGKVATPTTPYGTVKAGMVYYEVGLNLASTTIYVACGTAGQVAEIICWS